MAGRQIKGQGGRRERLLTPHDLAGIVTAQQGFVTGPIDYNSLINKPVIPSHLTDLDTTVSGAQLNSLKTKVDGIQAGAQVNVQSDWNAVSGDAFIVNKPTIPAAQVNSDWNAVSGVAQILNKPTLATVATSGSYNDLSSKPTALPPNGPAGGSLTGTYPNPGVIVPVNSVFGRTGAVAATGGDYNTGQVTEGTNLYFTAARVLATVLAGLSTATNAVITAADTVLSALGKLQAQISANVIAIAGKLTASNNLSDLSNNATAVTNLHVGFSRVSVNLTVNQTALGQGAFTTLKFNNVVIDSISEYSAATGAVTVKDAGVYMVSAQVHREGLLDKSDNATSIFVNGSEIKRLSEQNVNNGISTGGGQGCGGSCLLTLNANDVITCRSFASSVYAPSDYADGIPSLTYMDIWRLM